MATPVTKTNKSQFHLLLPLTATTAQLINLTPLITSTTFPEPSETKVSKQTYADEVDVQEPVSVAFGDLQFNMLHSDLAAYTDIIEDIMKAQFKTGRLFVAKCNGVTAVLPTLPVAADFIPTYTLPTGPYAHAFSDYEVSVGALVDQGELNNIWRYTLKLTTQGGNRGLKGSSATVPM